MNERLFVSTVRGSGDFTERSVSVSRSESFYVTIFHPILGIDLKLIFVKVFFPEIVWEKFSLV